MNRVDNVQGPRGSKGPNQNEPEQQPLYMGHEGLATPVVGNIIMILFRNTLTTRSHEHAHKSTRFTEVWLMIKTATRMPPDITSL